MKAVLHKLAIQAEAIFDSVVPNADADPVLETYRGYATPTHLVARGRVLTAIRRRTPQPDQSKWVNFRQMVSLFLTDEVRDVVVRGRGLRAKSMSDEEGYVTLKVPRKAVPVEDGWAKVPMTLDGGPEDDVAVCDVRVVSRDARFGVISDIDDTMMETGAFSLARNLWTTFTGSANTRHVFPDSVAVMDRLSEDGRNPVYYVSSSPWNLHGFLNDVFRRAGLAEGPMFLRDLGIGENQFISGTHGDHKGAAIDRMLGANPGLRFVLLGDTGQHDAEVYRDAAKRHSGRIAAVMLREPCPGPDTVSRDAMEALRVAGTPVYSGRDFAAAKTFLDTHLVADDETSRRDAA